jgi:hypothetical protein
VRCRRLLAPSALRSGSSWAAPGRLGAGRRTSGGRVARAVAARRGATRVVVVPAHARSIDCQSSILLLHTKRQPVTACSKHAKRTREGGGRVRGHGRVLGVHLSGRAVASAVASAIISCVRAVGRGRESCVSVRSQARGERAGQAPRRSRA